MKRALLTAGVLAVLCAGPVAITSTPAHAGNSAVEASLSNYGDVSMFYQALLNTGVINELNENQHYTIFAPTNTAFQQISPHNYPCFYSEECRPQIAQILRNHIVPGTYSLADLKSYGQGVKTLGDRRVLVEEQYVGQYTVNGQNIMSNGDTGNNVIYRIGGVISDPQELAQFQTMHAMPASAMMVPPGESMSTTKTITQRTYNTSGTSGYPGGAMDPYPQNPADNMTETTTTIHRYTSESE